MATQSYLFVFGRTPRLAFAELHTLFPQSRQLTDDIAIIEDLHTPDLTAIMHILGGTTKIASLCATLDQISADTLIGYLSAEVQPVEFGLSFYGFEHAPELYAREIKKKLEEQGVRSRYLMSRHGDALSTVVVDKAHLQELIIIKKEQTFFVAKTIAVQPYEEWNTRDYGRPYADAKSGMLPPKVARMIVNIASNTPYSVRPTQKTLYDPFCGMGTVLAEGYMVGHKVAGSDNSADVVEKAKKNMEWLMHTYPDAGDSIGDLHVYDAVHLSENITPNTIDAVVTEPYMGSTNIANQPVVDPKAVKNIIKGLEKLYIGCLRDWHKILVPSGRIIIALPSYALSGREYFVKKVVDMCENLGYTIVDGPIEYSRPQAIVKRMFYILRKK